MKMQTKCKLKSLDFIGVTPIFVNIIQYAIKIL